MDEKIYVEATSETPSPPPADETEGATHTESTKTPSGSGFREVLEKGMESLSKALNAALEDRGNVVMVRVNDEALRHLDMLVEAEITKSRSESAAFLINAGIEHNHDLFQKIGEITAQIAALRSQLREAVNFDETHQA